MFALIKNTVYKCRIAVILSTCVAKVNKDENFLFLWSLRLDLYVPEVVCRPFVSFTKSALYITEIHCIEMFCCESTVF